MKIKKSQKCPIPAFHVATTDIFMGKSNQVRWLLKDTLAWDFTSGFLRKRTHFVPWFILWICFKYNFFIGRKNLNFKLILIILRIWGKKFCKPEWVTIFFLDGLGSSCHCTVHTIFWSSVPLKDVEKNVIPNIQIYFGAFLKDAELIWAIPRTWGAKLCTFMELKERNCAL